MEQVKN